MLAATARSAAGRNGVSGARRSDPPRDHLSRPCCRRAGRCASTRMRINRRGSPVGRLGRRAAGVRAALTARCGRHRILTTACSGVQRGTVGSTPGSALRADIEAARFGPGRRGSCCAWPKAAASGCQSSGWRLAPVCGIALRRPRPCWNPGSPELAIALREPKGRRRARYELELPARGCGRRIINPAARPALTAAGGSGDGLRAAEAWRPVSRSMRGTGAA